MPVFEELSSDREKPASWSLLEIFVKVQVYRLVYRRKAAGLGFAKLAPLLRKLFEHLIQPVDPVCFGKSVRFSKVSYLFDRSTPSKRSLG